eukprot:symbB.v1.2.040124.t1/scaffold6173.1/size22531/1
MSHRRTSTGARYLSSKKRIKRPQALGGKTQTFECWLEWKWVIAEMRSTTVLLAALDNSTRIHGKLHPMIAVLSIGDCELLMLRRTNGRQSELEAVFHTEMQRIDYNVQTPLQLARVDERIDEEFDESIALEAGSTGVRTALIHRRALLICPSSR